MIRFRTAGEAEDHARTEKARLHGGPQDGIAHRHDVCELVGIIDELRYALRSEYGRGLDDAISERLIQPNPLRREIAALANSWDRIAATADRTLGLPGALVQKTWQAAASDLRRLLERPDPDWKKISPESEAPVRAWHGDVLCGGEDCPVLDDAGDHPKPDGFDAPAETPWEQIAKMGEWWREP